jgi:hypothetical protein
MDKKQVKLGYHTKKLLKEEKRPRLDDARMEYGIL